MYLHPNFESKNVHPRTLQRWKRLKDIQHEEYAS